MKGPRSYDHVVALDGLRFVAAAIVLVGHTYNTIVKPLDLAMAVRQSPLAILLNGYGAVHLFFILSGFCLAGSAERVRTAAGLAQFYVRRVFRIHPPYMFALLFAWLASFAYDTSQAHGGLTAYLMKRAHVHLPVRELVGHLLYPGPAGHQLGPAWTLFVEMNFSFLLPLMVWLSRRTHWSLLVLLSLLPIYAPPPGVLLSSLQYALFFSIGIAIFQERARLGRWLERLPAPAALALLAAGLALFAAPLNFALVYRHPRWGLVVSAAGGTLLLLCAIYLPRVGRALSGQAVAYGGRISYSFYLLHLPLMILGTRTISGAPGPLEFFALVALVFATTTAGAALAYRFVERPSIVLGNLLCRRIAAATAASPQLSRLAT